MARMMVSTTCGLTLGLAACGGGGGVGSTPAPPSTNIPTPTTAPPPPPPPASSVNYATSEYQRSNGALSSNAISAWQAGATGAGVKLGVIDSGINPGLAEFAGRIDPASRDVAGNRPLSDEDGHGTAVAATAAGARNDAQNLGVAFDATIIALRADSVGSCAQTGEDEGCKFGDSAIANGLDAARVAGARVINMSLGGDAAGQALLTAIGRAVDAGIVIVISAGNDGEDPAVGANANAFALSAAQSFPGGVVIAGALDTDLTRLVAFSNRAGTGSQWYLAALGRSVRTINHEGVGYLYSGTSFAAPIISGASALLAQAFPNLSGRQIIDILFRTADDLGTAGNDAEFGHGRLNIQRAFQPLGQTTLAGSKEVVTQETVTGRLPEASGDASKRKGSFGAIVLDGYSRAFAINLAKGLRETEPRRPLATSIGHKTRSSAAALGPIAMTLRIASRSTNPPLEMTQLTIGSEDARQSRLVAGNAVARIGGKTQIAFGLSESAELLEQTINGETGGAFLVARSVGEGPGFKAARGRSLAIRHVFKGSATLTLSAEQGKAIGEHAPGEPKRSYGMATTSIDLPLSTGTRASLGVSALNELHSQLGGHLGQTFGPNPGAASLFADAELRHKFGSGLQGALVMRRGQTKFGGGAFWTSAYALDFIKVGIVSVGDNLGLRISQPLRVYGGGLSRYLPTGYDYMTGLVSNGRQKLSLEPSGREINVELSYGTPWRRGWVGTNLFGRRHPGHAADADIDLGAAILASFAF